MRKSKEIKVALKEMEVRRTSAVLDLFEYKPNVVKYDTEIIRRMETIDCVIRTLKWVLNSDKNDERSVATEAQ